MWAGSGVDPGSTCASHRLGGCGCKGGVIPIEFEGSQNHTLGIEEELHIVGATTGELVPKVEEIMSRLPEDLKEAVSYELFQSVLEIKTPPCATVAEAEGVLRGLRSRVGSWAAACGDALASAGTHPFSLYKDQKITNQERYERVIETIRWVAQRDRKSTRLNSSHANISYAVFCLKKKKQ